jgi:hypothetical protein
MYSRDSRHANSPVLQVVHHSDLCWSRDSQVSIVIMLQFRFLAGVGMYSIRYGVQTETGAHPASYLMGTGSSFPGGKADGARNWPLASN